MALAPIKINIDELTTETPDGSGVFDVMMKSIKNHIQEEYEENRITGEEYTKAYIELTSAALASAMQFLTQRETIYSQSSLLDAQRAQVEAQTAVTNYQLGNILPAELAQLNKNIELAEAQRQVTLTEKQIADYNLQSVLPANVSQTIKQTERLTAEIVGIAYRNTDILPEEKRQMVFTTDTVLPANVAKVNYETTELMPQQKENLVKDAAIKDFQLSSTLVQQLELLKEQTEVQHAQTKDTRIDGITPVSGAVGKQKDLYSQQIDSYKKDARYKVGKMYLDAWITQKSLDEGLNAPAQLTNVNIDAVLADLRTDNSLT